MKYKDADLKRLFEPKTFHKTGAKQGMTGIDTETDKRGNIVLIASDRDYIIDRKGINTYDALNFISQYRNNTVWFYNLQFDFDAIMKSALIHVKRGSREHKAFQNGEFIIGADNRMYAIDTYLFSKRKKRYGNGTIKPLSYDGETYFYIEYRSGKSLTIHKREHGKYRQTACFDISNFLNSGSLDLTAQVYLRESKHDSNVSNQDLDITDVSKIPDSLLVRRCMKDADLTMRLGKYLDGLMKEISSEFNFQGSFNYSSKASLTETMVKAVIGKKHLRPYELPIELKESLTLNGKTTNQDFYTATWEECQKYALKSYKGGIFQLRSKGRFRNLDYVDINSAYPNIMRSLRTIDRTHVIYVNSRGLELRFADSEWEKFAEPLYAFYHVKMQFDGYSPYRMHDDGLIYPVTQELYDNYITKEELIFLLKRGYRVKVIDGYEIYPNSSVDHDRYIEELPFKEYIDRLYELKKKYKHADKGKYLLIKILMNSLYGKTAQSKYGLGSITNFVYASVITARVRIQIATHCERYFNRVVEIATDSITGYLNERGRNFYTHNEALGQFSLEDSDKAPDDVILIASGLAIKPSQTGIDLYKTRGFNIQVTDQFGQKMKGSISISKDRKHLHVNYNKPMHSKEAILQGHVEDINEFKDRIKEIALNDDKRAWGKEFIYDDLVSGNYESYPLNDLFLLGYERGRPNARNRKTFYYEIPEAHLNLNDVIYLFNVVFSANLPYREEDVQEVRIQLTDSLTGIISFPIEMPYARMEMPIPYEQYLPRDKHPDSHTVRVYAMIRKTAKGRYHDKNRKAYLRLTGHGIGHQSDHELNILA